MFSKILLSAAFSFAFCGSAMAGDDAVINIPGGATTPSANIGTDISLNIASTTGGSDSLNTASGTGVSNGGASQTKTFRRRGNAPPFVMTSGSLAERTLTAYSR